MPSSFSISFILILLICFPLLSKSSPVSPASSQLQETTDSCINHAFSNNVKTFKFCNDLPVLNSFIHWNYNPSTRMVDIAYRRVIDTTTSTWVAWAINPTSTHMIGSQAFVAFKGPNGNIHAYTAPVTSYRTLLEEGPLSFPVHEISATYVDNEITIFATFELPNENNNNSTIINHLWQDGPLINGDTLGMHRTSGVNVRSFGTLDLLSGHISKPSKGGNIPRHQLKNVHGVLNAVSWGTLMPLGAIIARHLKAVNFLGPTWFYLHIFCQTTAYAVGIGGWATGLILGKKSSGIQYDTHRNIGIVLLPLATLQVFALILRPKPDHKNRFYWNIYHHTTGYIVIILSIINVFKGIEILDPEKKWKNIYIGVIVTLGAAAAVLEVISLYVVMKRKRSITSEKTEPTTSGVVHGYQVEDDHNQPGPLSIV